MKFSFNWKKASIDIIYPFFYDWVLPQMVALSPALCCIQGRKPFLSFWHLAIYSLFCSRLSCLEPYVPYLCLHLLAYSYIVFLEIEKLLFQYFWVCLIGGRTQVDLILFSILLNYISFIYMLILTFSEYKSCVSSVDGKHLSNYILLCHLISIWSLKSNVSFTFCDLYPIETSYRPKFQIAICHILFATYTQFKVHLD